MSADPRNQRSADALKDAIITWATATNVTDPQFALGERTLIGAPAEAGRRKRETDGFPEGFKPPPIDSRE